MFGVVVIKAKTPRFDYKKEQAFKELSTILSEAGYTVRREQLKRGHGWKAMSGACRAVGSKLVLVDRRLTQDEQIGFLISQIREAEIQIVQERSAVLPSEIAERLTPRSQA